MRVLVWAFWIISGLLAALSGVIWSATRRPAETPSTWPPRYWPGGTWKRG